MITKMKKKLVTLSLLLTFSLVFGTTSCTAKAKDSKKDNSTATKATINKDETKTYARHISQKEFIDLVADYKNMETWQYKGKLPAIVDFYATWCGPCRQIAPILEKLAKEYDGKLVIYKVDVDNSKELARAFEVKSIPSLLFVPMKGEPKMSVGSLPEKELKERIDKMIK